MTVLDVTANSLSILKDAIIIFSMSFVITGVAIGLFQTIFSVQDPGLPMAAKLIVLIFLLTQVGGSIYEEFGIIFQRL